MRIVTHRECSMKLNLMTSMSTTGYGVVGNNVVNSLIAQGVDVCLWPYGNIQPQYQPMVNNQINVDPDAPCLNIWHQFDLAKRVGNGKYFAWPFFELDKFTPQEKAHLKVPNTIIASSQWAVDIILDQVPQQTVVKIPCGVDSSIFKPSDTPRDENKPYTFFNIGKWEKRKGHDVLIRAFDKAFDISDDVLLVMMPHNPFLREHQKQAWVNMYSNAKLSSKVSILGPVPTHQHVARIINNCDCGVFPSRAEGWNLELLESMACGKPVITTNNSAHTEFCDGVNAFLIDTPEMEDAYDGIFFDGHGQWAEFDIDQEDQLIEYMRNCYKNRPTNISGVTTAEHLSWARTAAGLTNAIFNHDNVEF